MAFLKVLIEAILSVLVPFFTERLDRPDTAIEVTVDSEDLIRHSRMIEHKDTFRGVEL